MNTDQSVSNPVFPSVSSVARIEPPSSWPSIGLRELWEYRELLYFLTWRDIKVRYKQTVLGAAWAVIQPLFMMLVFSLFFGKLAGVPSDGIPYPVFTFCGLLPWQLFAHSLTQASNSLVGSQNLITKVYFPRLVVPISAVLGGVVDFAIAFVLLLLMMFYYGIVPGWQMVALPRSCSVGSTGCSRRWSLALRAERAVQRRALHDQFPGPILVVCDAGGLSEFDRAGEVARSLWTQSDGGRRRWFSLGAARQTGIAGRAAVDFRDCCLPASRRRPLLLPPHGATVCRHV